LRGDRLQAHAGEWTVTLEEYTMMFMSGKVPIIALVQSLCSSERLRALVTVQPKFQLSIHDDEGWFGKKFPPEVDVLVFDVAENIRDIERLKGLYDVFAETLHQLSKLGIAGQENHGVTT